MTARKNQPLATLTSTIPTKSFKLTADQIPNVKVGVPLIFDPPLDWDAEQCLRYIQGATSVANVCQGLSKHLDNLVLAYHNVATEKYDS